MSSYAYPYVYVLIPLLPLLAFVLLALSGRRLEGKGHRVVVPAVGLSFALTVAAGIEVATNGPVSIPLYHYLQSGSFTVELGLYIDQLAVLLLLLVTGVSGIVQVYSSRYMIGDGRHSRFFAVTALFTFAMTMVVTSNNLLLTYVFWEVMGICSYLLISHYAHRESACRAATKAFLVNAVADVGLGLGVILTFQTFGTLDIRQVLAAAPGMSGETVNVLGWAGLDGSVGAVTLITLLLFVGGMGKSAQMPFHVWLPFAMEAPTPVSALIHAATMVNAGPFLLVRLSPLVVLSPPAMIVIATVGAATALFAALVSLTQSDIKKILAYSTVSQIGFMIFACGVGAFTAAIFHLLAHGFLKAFLFLSTGNTLASVHEHAQAHAHTQTDDHGNEGAPGAFTALALGALLLASIPPFIIFSAPYERLWVGEGFASASVAFWVVGLGAVFFTAMYLFRGVATLFRHGPPAGRSGVGVLRVTPRLFSPSHLAAVSAAALLAVGALWHVWTWVAEFLAPAVARGAAASAPASDAFPTAFSPWILLPLAVAVSGWGFAYALHRKGGTGFGQSGWMRPLYVFFLNKGYFDEIYDVYVVQPNLRWAGWLWRRVDSGGIDRFFVGLGSLTERLSRWLWHWLDMGGISGNVERFARTLGGTGRALQRLEPRTLQQHLLVLVVWLVAAIGFFHWLV